MAVTLGSCNCCGASAGCDHLYGLMIGSKDVVRRYYTNLGANWLYENPSDSDVNFSYARVQCDPHATAQAQTTSLLNSISPDTIVLFDNERDKKIPNGATYLQDGSYPVNLAPEHNLTNNLSYTVTFGPNEGSLEKYNPTTFNWSTILITPLAGPVNITIALNEQIRFKILAGSGNIFVTGQIIPSGWTQKQCESTTSVSYRCVANVYKNFSYQGVGGQATSRVNSYFDNLISGYSQAWSDVNINPNSSTDANWRILVDKLNMTSRVYSSFLNIHGEYIKGWNISSTYNSFTFSGDEFSSSKTLFESPEYANALTGIEAIFNQYLIENAHNNLQNAYDNYQNSLESNTQIVLNIIPSIYTQSGNNSENSWRINGYGMINRESASNVQISMGNKTFALQQGHGFFGNNPYYGYGNAHIFINNRPVSASINDTVASQVVNKGIVSTFFGKMDYPYNNSITPYLKDYLFAQKLFIGTEQPAQSEAVDGPYLRKEPGAFMNTVSGGVITASAPILTGGGSVATISEDGQGLYAILKAGRAYLFQTGTTQGYINNSGTPVPHGQVFVAKAAILRFIGNTGLSITLTETARMIGEYHPLHGIYATELEYCHLSSSIPKSPRNRAISFWCPKIVGGNYSPPFPSSSRPSDIGGFNFGSIYANWLNCYINIDNPRNDGGFSLYTKDNTVGSWEIGIVNSRPSLLGFRGARVVTMGASNSVNKLKSAISISGGSSANAGGIETFSGSSGGRANIRVLNLRVGSVTFFNNGTGYSIGDLLHPGGNSVPEGSYTQYVILRVTQISPGGDIIAVTIDNAGIYTSISNPILNFVGGTGTGAAFSLQFESGSLQVVYPDDIFTQFPLNPVTLSDGTIATLSFENARGICFGREYTDKYYTTRGLDWFDVVLTTPSPYNFFLGITNRNSINSVNRIGSFQEITPSFNTISVLVAKDRYTPVTATQLFDCDGDVAGTTGRLAGYEGILDFSGQSWKTANISNNSGVDCPDFTEAPEPTNQEMTNLLIP